MALGTFKQSGLFTIFQNVRQTPVPLQHRPCNFVLHACIMYYNMQAITNHRFYAHLLLPLHKSLPCRELSPK